MGNYASDSIRLFGRFLHHHRARTPDEVAAIPIAYSRTKDEYRTRFGISPPDEIWGATTSAASMCGGGDKHNGLDPYPESPTTTYQTMVVGTSTPERTLTQANMPQAAAVDNSTSAAPHIPVSSTPQGEVTDNSSFAFGSIVVHRVVWWLILGLALGKAS